METKKLTGVFLSIIVTVAYIAVKLLNPALFGASYYTFSLLPIIIFAWYFGMWPGIIVAAISFFVNLLIAFLISDNSFFAVPAESLIGWTAVILVALVVGKTSELIELLQITQSTTKTTLEDWISIFDSLSDGISIHTPDHTILNANTALTNILGKKREELIGKKCYAVYHGTSTPLFACPMEKSLVTKKKSELEYFEPALNAWLFVTTVPQLDQYGRITKFIHTVRDVTARRNTESEIRKLAQIVESSDDAIYSKDLEGTIKTWNKGAENIFGYSAQEMIGQPVNLLLPPDRPDEVKKMLEIIKSGGKVEHYETQRRNKLGQLLYVSLTISPIKDEAGNIVGASTIARDITVRIQAEKELKRSTDEVFDLYNNAPCGYHSLNENGMIVRINDTELEWLGYSRDELLNRVPFYQLLTGDCVDSYNQSFSLLKQQGWVKDLEFELVRKNGSILPVLLNATAITDNNGKLKMIRVTAFDITQRKIAEHQEEQLLKETQRANAQLQKMDRSKDEFLSIITHDLKSPLTGIIGYTDMLLEGMAGVLSKQQQAFIEIIKTQSATLQTMIDSILDYTRAEFGTLKTRPELYSINRQLAELMELFQPQAREKKIDFQVFIPSEDIIINADRGMIGRVIANLLGNALKYTADNGRVKVDLVRKEDVVCFSVADNGQGIAQEKIGNVFDKFYMVDASSAREKRSLGLGLYICKSFIDAHHGRIWAASPGEGLGSTFAFTLPLTLNV